MVITFYPHPGFLENEQKFGEIYKPAGIIGVGDLRYSKSALKKEKDRLCRFCGQKYPEVSFSNRAHLMPKMIGNVDLFSDFECNECNNLFSRFETDLSYYLGISRSIIGLEDEALAPSYVAKKITAKSRSFADKNILIVHPKDLESDPENKGRMTLKYIKSP